MKREKKLFYKHIYRGYLFLTMAILASVSYADKYDDAVLEALKVPQKEEDKEPEIPSYEDTLKYIMQNIDYELTETSRCNFTYKETDGNMLTISSFNAGNLLARTEIDLGLKCDRMAKCIYQDYWGFGNKSLYKHYVSFTPTYLKEFDMQKAEIFAESLNHLIALCGGSREY